MKRIPQFRLLLLLVAGLAAPGLPAHLDAQGAEAPKASASQAPAATPLQAPAPATDAAPESPAIGAGDFFESIDVSVVNVDVYVTDKKGNRVNGLTRDDFEIIEDKKPMAITNFYAVTEGRPVMSEEELAAPAEPVPGAVPGMPPPVPEDQRLHLVVYIDNFNIHPFSRNKVFGSLREFLRSDLTPGDRVMLMTYDREPHVRRPFTSDPAGHRFGALRAREAERLRHPGRLGAPRRCCASSRT